MKCTYRASDCVGRNEAVYEVEYDLPELDHHSPPTYGAKAKVCKKCLEAIKRRVFKMKGGVIRFRLFGSDEWSQYGYDPRITRR